MTTIPAKKWQMNIWKTKTPLDGAVPYTLTNPHEDIRPLSQHSTSHVSGKIEVQRNQLVQQCSWRSISSLIP